LEECAENHHQLARNRPLSKKKRFVKVRIQNLEPTKNTNLRIKMIKIGMTQRVMRKVIFEGRRFCFCLKRCNYLVRFGVDRI